MFIFQNSGGITSDEELAWAFSDNKNMNSSTNNNSLSFGDTFSFNTMSKKEQEEADHKFALALSRGEIADSEA